MFWDSTASPPPAPNVTLVLHRRQRHDRARPGPVRIETPIEVDYYQAMADSAVRVGSLVWVVRSIGEGVGERGLDRTIRSWCTAKAYAPPFCPPNPSFSPPQRGDGAKADEGPALPVR